MLKRPNFALNPSQTLIARDAGFAGVDVFDVEDGADEPRLRIERDSIGLAALFFPTDDELWLLTREGRLSAYQLRSDDDGESAERIWQIQILAELTASSARAGKLAVGDQSGRLWLVERLADGRASVVTSKGAHRDAVLHVAFSGDGRRIASSGRDRVLSVWALPHEPILDERSIVAHAEGLQTFSVAESSDLPDVPAVSEHDVLAFFSAASEVVDEASPVEPVVEESAPEADPAPEAESAPVEGDAGSADGIEDEAEASPEEADRNASSLSVESGVPQVLERQVELTGAEGWQACVAFSPDDRRLLSGGIDYGVYLWSLEPEPRLERVQYAHHGWIVDVAWSRDGGTIATGSWDNTIGIFDGETLEPRVCYELHRDYVSDVEFVGEELLVAASYDHDISVWNVARGELVGVLEGHVDWVEALAVLDERRVLSISSDKTTRIFDVEALVEMAAIGAAEGAGMELGAPVMFSEYVDTRQLASTSLASRGGAGARYRDYRASGFRAASGQTAMALLEGAIDTQTPREARPAEPPLESPSRLLERFNERIEPQVDLTAQLDETPAPSEPLSEVEESLPVSTGSDFDSEGERAERSFSQLEREIAEEAPAEELSQAEDREATPVTIIDPQVPVDVKEEPDPEPEPELELEPPVAETEEEQQDEIVRAVEEAIAADTASEASEDEGSVRRQTVMLPGEEPDTRTVRGMAPARLGEGLVGQSDAAEEDDPEPQHTTIGRPPVITSYDAGESQELLTMDLGGEPSSARLDSHEPPQPFDPVNDPPSVEIPHDLALDEMSEGSMDLDWDEIEQSVDSAMVEAASWAGRDDTRPTRPNLGGDGLSSSAFDSETAPRLIRPDRTSPRRSENGATGQATRPKHAQLVKPSKEDSEFGDPPTAEFVLEMPVSQSAQPTVAEEDSIADSPPGPDGDVVEDATPKEIWSRLPSVATPKLEILAEREKPGARTFEQAHRIKTPHEFVYSVAVSHDGQQIATCGGDNSVCIWSRGGDLLHRFRVKTDGLNSIAFSFDGRAVVAGGDDCTVHLWLIPPAGSRAPVQHAPMEGHVGWISSVAFSDEGSFVMTGSYDGTARVWKLQSGKCVRTLRGHEGAVAGVAIGTSRAFTVGHDGSLRVYNQKWAQVDLIAGHDRLLDVSTNGHVTVFSAANGDVFVVREGRESPLLRHRGQARGVHVRGDGCVFTAGEDGQLRVYLAGADNPNQLLATGTPLWSIDARRDVIACGADDGFVYLFTETGT